MFPARYNPHPRPVFESAIYGAAGIARHVELTRLLLERGADPNDEETPYHVPQTADNEVLQVLLDSGRLSGASLCSRCHQRLCADLAAVASGGSRRRGCVRVENRAEKAVMIASGVR